MYRSLLCLSLVVLSLRASLKADEIRVHFTDESAPRSTTSGPSADKLRGRYCLPDYIRSGWPRCIGTLARPDICRDYSLGYVGGSAHWFGEPRTCQEGTVGLDYQGWFFARRTWLQWTHGRRYQGGDGKYATDGPKLLE